MGDFNYVLNLKERLGRAKDNTHEMDDSIQCLDSCRLQDIKGQGF